MAGENGRGKAEPDAADRNGSGVVSFLPQPVLVAFRLNVDKAVISTTSGGDVPL